jgi:glutathione S-transferase
MKRHEVCPRKELVDADGHRPERPLHVGRRARAARVDDPHRQAPRASRSFIAPQLETHLGFMESELARAAWFAGADFTAADIQMSYPIEAAQARVGFTEATRPRLSAYLQAIRARPAYARAVARGGPYGVVAG